MNDKELHDFVRAAAAAARCSPDELLRRVLHVGTVDDDPRFTKFFARAKTPIRELFKQLDVEVRIRNPAAHYVFRSTYFGYRREDPAEQMAGSERVQVFLSVIPRRDELLLVLPVDPADYEDVTDGEVLAGKGHHGVGNFGVRVTKTADITKFISRFDNWITVW